MSKEVKKLESLYKHELIERVDGSIVLVMGMDKNISDEEADEIAEMDMLNMPMSFWHEYFGLSLENRMKIDKIMDEKAENNKGFRLHNWEVILDYILSEYGKNQVGIAKDMVKITEAPTKIKLPPYATEYDKRQAMIINEIFDSIPAGDRIERKKVLDNLRASLNENNYGDRPLMKIICAFYLLSEDLPIKGEGMKFFVDENAYDGTENIEARMKLYDDTFNYDDIIMDLEEGKTVREILNNLHYSIKDNIQEVAVKIVNTEYMLNEEDTELVLSEIRKLKKEQE